MNKLAWRYVKPLANPAAIDDFEKEHSVAFPADLKSVLAASNGGRPSLRYLDLPGRKDKEFKTLLSFNPGDKETIFGRYPVASSDKSLLPFASDSFGNLFVVKNDCIWLWNHEDDSLVFVAPNFTDFLRLLHE